MDTEMGEVLSRYKDYLCLGLPAPSGLLMVKDPLGNDPPAPRPHSYFMCLQQWTWDPDLESRASGLVTKVDSQQQGQTFAGNMENEFAFDKISRYVSWQGVKWESIYVRNEVPQGKARSRDKDKNITSYGLSHT